MNPFTPTRLVFLVFFIAQACLAPAAAHAQGPAESDVYCTAYAGCGMYITGVTIGMHANAGTPCSTSGYGNYTLQFVTMGVGQSINVQVTGSGTNANSICKMWIDWNQNTDFNDPGDLISFQGSPGPGPYTAVINVPAGLPSTYTRIRIRLGQGTVNPCGYMAQGETEDYTADVTNDMIITGLSSQSFCPGAEVQVSYSGGSGYTPDNEFIAQLSNASGSFTNPVDIGSLMSEFPQPILAQLPPATPPGNAYRIRVVSTDPSSISLDNGSNLIVHTPPLVDAGPDVAIYEGGSVQLNPAVTGGTAPYTYLWSPPDGLDNPAAAQPLASPSASTNYTLSITDANGCHGSDQLVVTVLPAAPGQVEGVVRYDNNAQTPLNNVTVILENAGGTVATTTTNAGGAYAFMEVPAGNYSIRCTSSAPWGGGNAVDALLIMKHFTNLQTISGIKLVAADVDQSSFVNATDALTTMKRFVGMISSYAPGDWAFETKQFAVTPNQTSTLNLKAVCYSDVDGSFIP